MMDCPKCGGTTGVRDTRGVRRIRECVERGCRHMFTTEEREIERGTEPQKARTECVETGKQRRQGSC